MTDAPLVSVIVPAWNAEATITDTLRSAAAQTYAKLEIIVVDDGSTDRTAALVEAFCRKEPRARLIRKENGGVASARNRGIAEAKGEWIAPLDADDLWHPTKIEKEVAAVLAAPVRPGLVYSWRRILDREGRVISDGIRRPVEGSVFRQFAYINMVACGSAMLVSRNAAIEAGGYDEELHAQRAQGYEDLLLQLTIARSHPVAVVPEHLVGWRSHDMNMSGDLEQMARSGELMFQRLADAGAAVPSKVRRWVAARETLEVADQRATQGRFGATAGLLAKSLLLDPVGTGLALAHRRARSLRRRLSRGEAAPRPHFQDLDPISASEGDRHEIGWVASLVEGLDSRRLARLRKSELPLPLSGASADGG